MPPRLEQPYATWLVLDRKGLVRNWRAVRRAVRPARLIAVVKANAYGHGAVESARAAEQAGASMAAVFGLAEVLAVTRALRIPVLNLAYPFPWEIPALVASGARQSVWDSLSAVRLAAEARRQGTAVGVHLKVDTGMNRVGVPASRAVELAHEIASLPGLWLDGVFTTLAERGRRDAVQIETFEEVTDRMKQEGIAIPMRHVTSSAGLGAGRERFDAARVGLKAYGFATCPGGPRLKGTAPVLKFYARVIDVKELWPGETCGYGGLFRAKHRMTVAVVAAGWADGLFRSLSNAWRAEIQGRVVPLIGRISANHAYLDVTRVPGVSVGMPVLLFGGRHTSWEDAAQAAGTSVYEVLSRLSPHLPRVAP